MIRQKGEFDSCNGVQLVLASLLSQTYAALSRVAQICLSRWLRWLTVQPEPYYQDDESDVLQPQCSLGSILWDVRFHDAPGDAFGV